MDASLRHHPPTGFKSSRLISSGFPYPSASFQIVGQYNLHGEQQRSWKGGVVPITSLNGLCVMTIVL